MTSTVDRFTGAVPRPGDPGCAAAVTGQNLAVVHQPALVVEARDAADLAVAVRYAAAEGPGVAVQSTGHGARRPVGGDTLLLRTAALDAVLVDPGARTATLGAASPPAAWSRPACRTAWPRSPAPRRRSASSG